MAPRIPALYILLGVGIISFYFYYRNITTISGSSVFSSTQSRHAANETLGFGGVFVVSGAGSKRRDVIIQSANVSELHLTIPDQPTWTKEQVDGYRDKGPGAKSTIWAGSIKALWSHHIALKAFLKSGAETALVLEDDVDWDIRLRTKQAPLAAAAMRSLLPPANDQEYYWGHPQDWDLIYLGHCGDFFEGLDGMQVGVGRIHPEDLEKVPHVLFKDETMPDPSDIHPFTSSFLTAFNLPPKTRIVHRSKWPLCTFGYAVTRHAAKRLLEELAPPKEVPGWWVHAYDIAILEACRDKGLRCTTVNPELFHHMEGTSMIDGPVPDLAGRPPADRVGLKQVKYRNETANINCGFWSKDFQFNGDQEKLAYLREEVGRKGRCLKPGRQDDGSRAAAPLLQQRWLS